ncbi:response regulator [Methylovulum psychrotolerans]|jgi:two-component system phosphate regulon response regulator OmpR|uniref:Two-component system response regulator OmpR n=1 Tax=Methylovulum psychrotolerans TaxID=1704499 RepID=A0A1Z4BWL4_9GAMM|nr:response regulator [Methylovulum psychrotolerans]ASF45652.1 two-component system response regulator OmpR [Methylovulum psychrotolerans]POZ53884.1 two-component system response regulator OmpR [Methylovulum psychrotolerans]
MSDRILIVDDDLEIRTLLTRYLSEQGLTVRAVENGVAMRRLMERETFDVLILDIMLPGEDGLSLCAKLRAEGFYLPTLMLTAKGQDIDRIIGIEVGADDYLPKPFNPRELYARIKSLLRRQAYAKIPGTPERGEQIPIGHFILDCQQRALKNADETINLTTGEFALLNALVSHPLKAQSRDRLLELSRNRDNEVSDRSIDVQIRRLRKILEDNPADPKFIQTVWGFGYVFVPTGEKR